MRSQMKFLLFLLSMAVGSRKGDTGESVGKQDVLTHKVFRCLCF